MSYLWDQDTSRGPQYMLIGTYLDINAAAYDISQPACPELRPGPTTADNQQEETVS